MADTWTPEFSEDDQPSAYSAICQAVGAASVCWADMSGAGVFDTDQAKAIADGLASYLGLVDQPPGPAGPV